MTYTDYIQSTAWRSNPARLREFEAAGFACRLCPAQAADGVTLGGHGMVGVDDVLTIESDGWDHIVVHGNKPATNPKIRAGDQEAEVPVEIVGPESVGGVDLVTDPTATDQFRLNARLHTSSGELIGLTE